MRGWLVSLAYPCLRIKVKAARGYLSFADMGLVYDQNPATGQSGRVSGLIVNYLSAQLHPSLIG